MEGLRRIQSSWRHCNFSLRIYKGHLLHLLSSPCIQQLQQYTHITKMNNTENNKGTLNMTDAGNYWKMSALADD